MLVFRKILSKWMIPKDLESLILKVSNFKNFVTADFQSTTLLADDADSRVSSYTIPKASALK